MRPCPKLRREKAELSAAPSAQIVSATWPPASALEKPDDRGGVVACELLLEGADVSRAGEPRGAGGDPGMADYPLGVAPHAVGLFRHGRSQEDWQALHRHGAAVPDRVDHIAGDQRDVDR